MLPDGSGFEVCRELRARSRVPIIMLTARGEEVDRVAGLELGADDYVVKPFSASSSPGCGRCSAAPPRRKSRDDGVTEIGDVRIDRPRRTASFRGEELELSRKEFDLLRLLVDNAGSVVTRERLIDEVWDTNWFGSTKTLDVHVSGLPKKLVTTRTTRATSTPSVVSASASLRPTSDEPARSPTRGVRLRARARDRRARGAADPERLAADRR